MTLEWPRPEGRVETYVVRWAAEGDEEPPHTKNITEQNLSASHMSEEQPVRVLIGDLMPGVKYLFEIHTVSYHLHSDITKLAARTSKLTRPCLLKCHRNIGGLNLTAVSFVIIVPSHFHGFSPRVAARACKIYC